MKRLASAAALVVVSIAATASAARDPAQEKAIEAAVSAVDPKLVDLLHDANDAADRGDDVHAAAAYTTLHAKAPDVVAITRRLCTETARTGQVAAGVAYCREAVAAEPSAENHAALAAAIVMGRPLPPAEAAEASAEARKAAKLAPDAEFAQVALCEVASARGDAEALDACTARLREIAPSSPATHLFGALALGHRGQIDDAERELDQARAAGLPQRSYEQTRAALEGARPTPHPFRAAAQVVGVVWVSVLFLVIVVGMLLGDATARSKSRGLHGAMRALLSLTAALFYASAVIMVAALAGAVTLVTMLFLAIAAPPRAVEIVLAVIALYLGVALARALFARVPPNDLGAKLDLSKNRELRRLLAAASSAVDMPKLDAVYVRADATIEVVELGGTLGHVRRRNRRVLLLGVAALEGLTRRELAALVASELGRFRAEDGAGGDVAAVASARLDAIVERMDARGVAIDANPAWWFVRAWRAMFERIASGALEAQEALADRWASRAFGSVELAKALRHVARREVETDARARASIRDAIDGAELELYGRPIDEDVRAAIDAALAGVEDRVAAFEAREEEGRNDDVGDEPAWTLFSDRGALERDMIERARRELRERAGIGADDQPSSASSVARA